VLDAAEWTAKKAAGEIVILPVGSGSIGEKSITQTRRINCQNLASACEQAAEFTSAIVDNVTFAEWDKYNIIEKAGLYLLPFFITCDNKIIISSNYTTGSNIGISKKNAKHITDIEWRRRCSNGIQGDYDIKRMQPTQGNRCYTSIDSSNTSLTLI
jgi:hypothetical protein